jgi:hypothetical protein
MKASAVDFLKGALVAGVVMGFVAVVRAVTGLGDADEVLRLAVKDSALMGWETQTGLNAVAAVEVCWLAHGPLNTLFWTWR